MNGFLVVQCHGMDDIPVRLFPSWQKREAFEFAENLGPDDAEAEKEAIETDASTPCCVKVVQFKEGRPINSTVARDYMADDE